MSDKDAEFIRKKFKERLPDKLLIKVGAKVMLLSNTDTRAGWVNGTLATVKGVFPNYILITGLDGQGDFVVTKVRQALKTIAYDYEKEVSS